MKNRINNHAHAEDGLLRLINTTKSANKKFNVYSQIGKEPINVIFPPQSIFLYLITIKLK